MEVMLRMQRWLRWLAPLTVPTVQHATVHFIDALVGVRYCTLEIPKMAILLCMAYPKLEPAFLVPWLHLNDCYAT